MFFLNRCLSSNNEYNMEYYYIILLMCVYEIGKWTVVKAENQKGIAMDTTDFDEIAKSKLFVDKTLLIKDVLKSPHHGNLILAPRKFGKTVNMNMIKRFCEIEVDESGTPKEKTQMTSFDLFKGLKVSSDEDFANTHFASYPVLHLDYSTLHSIESYENLFEKLVVLISETYAKHKYLLKNESLWAGFEKGLFQSYVNAQENHRDHNTHILTSLTRLCEILHKHFSRKVLVLIDEFDAYVYNAIFKDSKGIDKIMKLMIEIDGNLLKRNEHISKVILTGTLKVFREDMKDIFTYHFQEDHPFSPFYGLTKGEIDRLVPKIVSNCGEKYQLLDFITSYYGSYRIYSQDSSFLEIYNIWSVINYIVERKHVTDYLIASDSLVGFKTIFKAQTIKEELQALILGESVHVERCSPITEENIRTLNYIVKSYICPPSGVEVFLRLLYSLGYLTQVKENKGILLDQFKIPNNETYDELMRYTPV